MPNLWNINRLTQFLRCRRSEFTHFSAITHFLPRSDGSMSELTVKPRLVFGLGRAPKMPGWLLVPCVCSPTNGCHRIHRFVFGGLLPEAKCRGVWAPINLPPPPPPINMPDQSLPPVDPWRPTSDSCSLPTLFSTGPGMEGRAFDKV